MEIYKKISGAVYIVLLFLIFKAAGAKAGAISIKVTNQITSSTFAKIVENVLLWLLSVVGSLAVFSFIVGGVMYMTAGGDEQKTAAAKKVFTLTITGMVMIFVSYAIIVVIDRIFIQ